MFREFELKLRLLRLFGRFGINNTVGPSIFPFCPPGLFTASQKDFWIDFRLWWDTIKNFHHKTKQNNDTLPANWRILNNNRKWIKKFCVRYQWYRKTASLTSTVIYPYTRIHTHTHKHICKWFAYICHREANINFPSSHTRAVHFEWKLNPVEIHVLHFSSKFIWYIHSVNRRC